MKYTLLICLLFAISCNSKPPTVCEALTSERNEEQYKIDDGYDYRLEIEKSLSETDSMILKCGCGISAPIDTSTKETSLPTTQEFYGSDSTLVKFHHLQSTYIYCDTLFVHHIVQVP